METRGGGTQATKPPGVVTGLLACIAQASTGPGEDLSGGGVYKHELENNKDRGNRRLLEAAAKRAAHDYETDKELTAFTELDGVAHD